MTLFRCAVTLPMLSGLSADAATNTWYFDAISSGELPEIDLEVSQFYNQFLSTLSKDIDSSLMFYQWYDMSQPEPRLPIREAVRVGNATGGDTLPHEVALCLSYEGTRVSGLPQRNRRGRLYFGPLASNSLDVTTGRPSLALLNGLHDGAEALRAAGIAANTWSWVVYSPTLGTFADIQGGWVDNAFDTQRRRGRESTLRIPWI